MTETYSIDLMKNISILDPPIEAVDLHNLARRMLCEKTLKLKTLWDGKYQKTHIVSLAESLRNTLLKYKK